MTPKMHKLFQDIDKDGSGEIGYKELCEAVLDAEKHNAKHAKLSNGVVSSGSMTARV